jgi:hypothetical protein
MKENIFFISDSFNFNSSFEELFLSLRNAALIVNKMKSEKFVNFSKSSDFYDYALNKLYSDNIHHEAGQLASLLYDGDIGKVKLRDVNSEDIINLINEETPELDQHWIAIYGCLPPSINISYAVRNVNSELDIINYSQIILKNNNYTSHEYAEAIEGIYRNLIFHPEYNNLDNIQGGYHNFTDGILEMFSFMNAYIINDGNAKLDISVLDKNFKFKTCEEGGGKQRRKIEIEFEIDGTKKSYNCEFHCKLEFLDGQYKTGKYYDMNRMYFGFYKPQDKHNQFLIAHLGGHL